MKQKLEFQCQFCTKVFMKTVTEKTIEIRCPKCREYDCVITSFYGYLPEKGKENDIH